MAQNTKDAKQVAKARDKARFRASAGYEAAFENAYVSTVGNMMQAVLTQISKYGNNE